MEFRRIRDLREDSDRTQQEVADYIKKMLIEQMNSHTAISHT